MRATTRCSKRPSNLRFDGRPRRPWSTTRSPRSPPDHGVADARDGQLASSAVLLRFELNALVLLRATLAIGPVLVDSRRFAPFPWGLRGPMKPDISTLHKPDILILQRHIGTG